MDVIPKIGEIKSLKDLSTVLVLPIICASYIIQTEFSISIDDWVLSVSSDSNIFVQVLQLLLIFIGKTFYVSLVSLVLYVAVSYGDIYLDNTLIPLLVLILLTFGVVSIFSPGKVPFLNELHPLWYYTSFVTSFFLLAHYDRITDNT